MFSYIPYIGIMIVAERKRDMNCLHVPKILMPREGMDLYKWSVIACDQYTSQPEYWKKAEEIVGDVPSTLKLTLPEVYLESDKEEKRVLAIHQNMKEYLESGMLKEMPAGFVLTKRSFGKEHSRYGLVVEVDLETYEYKKGEHSLVRPTEMTVEERIPPRLRVRQQALIELPHIMLLIDDPEKSVIEPLVERADSFEQIYDTDLMLNGGHISGWMIPEGKETDAIMNKVEMLAEPEVFRRRYGLKEEYPLLNFAVGDGNHSMATAKAAWEAMKENLTEEERKTHPARYCLCEIVNIHDESLLVEPIHRVLFGVEKEEFFAAAKMYYEGKGCRIEITQQDEVVPYASEQEHCFAYCDKDGKGMFKVYKPIWGIAVASLQTFLDAYLAEHKETKIDYIHGVDVVEQLGTQEGNMGFLLPDIYKEDLFRGVITDGVLPRKTFSMGEANEKRYYMEGKVIRKL